MCYAEKHTHAQQEQCKVSQTKRRKEYTAVILTENNTELIKSYLKKNPTFHSTKIKL